MPLPGVRGADHIGFTVPDIEQAHEFLTEIVGCEHIYSLPGVSKDDDWMHTHLNVDPRSEIDEIRFYRCGFGTNFEVFQYSSASPQGPQPRNDDIGGHHIAFYVDDLDEAIDFLIANNVQVLGSPTSSGNASAGQRWVYFLAPWGMQFELVCFPEGKAYEASSTRHLWHPASPGR
ncbi:VOC family protein [Okibacterium endophyticum]